MASARRRLREIERKRLRKRSVLVFSFSLVLLFISFGLTRIVSSSFRMQPDLEFVSERAVRETFSVRGIIAREEKLLTSPEPGAAVMIPLQAEASKRPIGDPVAVLLNAGQVETYRRLQTITAEAAERRLQLLESPDSVPETFRDAYDKNRPDIVRQLDGLRKSASEDSMFLNASFERSIDALLFERNRSLEKVSVDDETLQKLNDEAQSIRQRLDAQSPYAVTQENAYVSYMTDGMETLARLDNFQNASLLEVEQWLTNAGTFHDIPSDVSQGAPIYRLVKGPKQYFALISDDIPEGYFDYASDSFSLYLPEENLWVDPCTLIRASYEGGRTLLICRTSSALEELMSRRVFHATLRRYRRSGLSVLNSALENETTHSDEEGIRRFAELMLISSGGTKRIRVEILNRDESFSIIKCATEADAAYLREGTVYVSNPKSVKEGVSLD